MPNESIINFRNNLIHLLYLKIAKKIFFKIDPEIVHNYTTNLGFILGSNYLTKKVTKALFYYKNKKLEQNISGIDFKNPVGLSAGFDYEAKLTKILPSLSFGFETIGTITNNPYGGNIKPMLGRLPKSKSLMVNKGFKNQGVRKVVVKLENYNFEIPIGISIGRTNSKEKMNQKEAVQDIVEAFKVVENSKVKFSYYELNISCPNLYGNINFYNSEKLRDLLAAVTKLKLKKPLFIKMPINETNEDTIKMLDVIISFPVKGVIFGNLQKDRNDPAFVKEEVKKFKVGNFSGKPTEKRSNELIQLAYKKYGKKLIIIGCGGVFSAEDAYKKVKLGASLVQLITGMIYEGPQLISEINQGLVKLLEKDNFNNISEAIGKENN